MYEKNHPPLRMVTFSDSFLLKGELGHFRISMKYDVRTRNGKKEVYVAPFADGRLFTDRGRWVNWETVVELVFA